MRSKRLVLSLVLPEVLLTVLLAVLLMLAGPTSPAHAGGIVSVCDEAHLRAALAGGGTVTFSCSGTITLTAEIVITAGTTIDGSGQAVTLSGNHAVRVFSVNEGVTLDLNMLTVADGSATGVGGGILNRGTLTVSNSTFSGNSVSPSPGPYGDSRGRGSGIYNSFGTVTVINSTFWSNSARAGGVSFRNDSIYSDDNLYPASPQPPPIPCDLGGGAIHSRGGTVTVTDSTFSGNGTSADDGGGAINNSYHSILIVSNSIFSGNSAIIGGGIYNCLGTATVTNCAFSNNSSVRSGGGILNGGGALSVSNSTFYGNNANSGWGGGIYGSGGTLTVSNSAFDGNSATFGGGIDNGGTLTVNNCTFHGNGSSSPNSRGGGIDNRYGTLTVSNSTFHGNSAGYGGGIVNYMEGTAAVSNSTFNGNAAIYNDGGGITNYGKLIVGNSTFDGNSATSGYGGGIADFSELVVSNCTFSGNGALGGGIFSAYGTVTLQNTIVANSPTGRNCAGGITDGGGNFSYPDTTCPGINADPRLGPLQDNGGSTWTMALLPGSAAVDAADDAICVAPPVNNLDQRGVTRPQGPHCDIGAFEAILQRTFLPTIIR